MMKLLSAGLFLAGLSSSIVLPQVFIAGGSPVLDANKYPNLVSLQQVGFHYCTGILLDPLTVLTSASCSLGRNPSPLLEAVQGSNDLSKNGLGKRMSVVKITKHPNFDKVSLQNDIAVWKLLDYSAQAHTNGSSSKSIETGTGGGNQPSNGGADMKLLPVEFLDATTASTSGKTSTFTIAGWGALQDGGDMLLKLHDAQVSVLDQGGCSDAYPLQYDVNSMICAAGSQGQDTCDGDSGAPLFSISSTGRLMVMGIASFGNGCGNVKFPGVYAKVSPFVSWINKAATDTSPASTPNEPEPLPM